MTAAIVLIVIMSLSAWVVATLDDSDDLLEPWDDSE